MSKPVHDIKLMLLYTTILILWWACVWGLFDEFVYYMSNKNPVNKVIIYLSLMIIIFGFICNNPDCLKHF